MRVCALDRATGKTRWIAEIPTTGYRTAAPTCWALGDLCVLAAQSHSVTALHQQTGCVLWSSDRFGSLRGAAIGDNGALYLAHGNMVEALAGSGLSEAGSVAGRITLLAGGSGESVPVSLRREDGEPAEVRTDASGAFRFRYVLPGHYQLRAGEHDAVQSVPIVVAAGRTQRMELRLPRARTGSIAGVLEAQGGRDHSQVIADPSHTRVQAVRSRGRVAAEVHPDDRGRYVLQGLSPGRYEVRVLCDESVPQVKSGMDVTAGTTLGHVDFLLTVNLAVVSFSGRVVAAETRAPLPSAQVHVFAGKRLVISATTDSAGLYHVRGLPTGSYTVRAEAEGFVWEAKEGIPVPMSGQAPDVDFVLTEEPRRNRTGAAP